MMPEPDESSFEELDSAAPQPARLVQRRELILGLLLVLLIGGWAGWDWWQGQSKFASYRAGQQAAADYRWEDALASFRAASGYADAEAQAANAASKIADRNRQYASGQSASKSGDWAAALIAFRAVKEIQPGFEDSDALAFAAETQVYSATVGGMVAMRYSADPPGLYYRAANGWVWLQGSDYRSAPRNYSNKGFVVYDVPDPTVQASPQPLTSSIALPDSARKLALAHLNPQHQEFTPLNLDSGNLPLVVWGARGGWGTQNGCVLPGQAQLRSFACDDEQFSAANGPLTSTVQLPGPGWSVLDLSDDGERILLADLSAAGASSPTSAIYVANADGSNRRMLYHDDGWIERAAFSENSRYAIATIAFSDPIFGTMKRAVLLDTDPGGTVRLISDMVGNPSTPVGMQFVTLNDNPNAMIALLERKGMVLTIKLIDTQGVKNQVSVIWLGWSLALPMTATRVAGGGLLICAQGSVDLEAGRTNSGDCALLDGAGHVTRYQVPLLARESLGYGWIRDGQMIYSVPTLQDYGKHELLVLRVAPLQEGEPTQFSEVLRVPQEPGNYTNVAPGSGLLAYARDRELHARTFDGKTDILLETGVDFIYDLREMIDTTVLY